MDNKVILISIDGMRPDGFLQCGHPFAQQMLKEWRLHPDSALSFPVDYAALPHIHLLQCAANPARHLYQSLYSTGQAGEGAG